MHRSGSFRQNGVHRLRRLGPGGPGADAGGGAAGLCVGRARRGRHGVGRAAVARALSRALSRAVPGDVGIAGCADGGPARPRGAGARATLHRARRDAALDGPRRRGERGASRPQARSGLRAQHDRRCRGRDPVGLLVARRDRRARQPVCRCRPERRSRDRGLDRRARPGRRCGGSPPGIGGRDGSTRRRASDRARRGRIGVRHARTRGPVHEPPGERDRLLGVQLRADDRDLPDLARARLGTRLRVGRSARRSARSPCCWRPRSAPGSGSTQPG